MAWRVVSNQASFAKALKERYNSKASIIRNMSLNKLSSTGTASELNRFVDRDELKDYAIESIATLVKEL